MSLSDSGQEQPWGLGSEGRASQVLVQHRGRRVGGGAGLCRSLVLSFLSSARWKDAQEAMGLGEADSCARLTSSCIAVPLNEVGFMWPEMLGPCSFRESTEPPGGSLGLMRFLPFRKFDERHISNSYSLISTSALSPEGKIPIAFMQIL